MRLVFGDKHPAPTVAQRTTATSADPIEFRLSSRLHRHDRSVGNPLRATAPYFVNVNESLHIPGYRNPINLDVTRGATNACAGISGTVSASAVSHSRAANGASPRCHSDDLRCRSVDRICSDTALC